MEFLSPLTSLLPAPSSGAVVGSRVRPPFELPPPFTLFFFSDLVCRFFLIRFHVLFFFPLFKWWWTPPPRGCTGKLQGFTPPPPLFFSHFPPFSRGLEKSGLCFDFSFYLSSLQVLLLDHNFRIDELLVLPPLVPAEC